MSAKEFQQSEYFDNILVSTIRFLDSFPAKTTGEKSSFMKGLNKVLPSFPKSVMEKKILPALLDEMKDKDLLSLILQNVFKIISILPASKRAFGEKVRPSLKETFITNAKANQEKDPAKDAGLMVVLDQMSLIASNCSGKEFKDGKQQRRSEKDQKSLTQCPLRYITHHRRGARVSHSLASRCSPARPAGHPPRPRL